MFDQTFHHVHEDAELVQIVLILSNPSSFSFAVQVTNTDGSAAGEYCSIMINYWYCIVHLKNQLFQGFDEVNFVVTSCSLN